MPADGDYSPSITPIDGPEYTRRVSDMVGLDRYAVYVSRSDFTACPAVYRDSSLVRLLGLRGSPGDGQRNSPRTAEQPVTQFGRRVRELPSTESGITSEWTKGELDLVPFTTVPL